MMSRRIQKAEIISRVFFFSFWKNLFYYLKKKIPDLFQSLLLQQNLTPSNEFFVAGTKQEEGDLWHRVTQAAVGDPLLTQHPRGDAAEIPAAESPQGKNQEGSEPSHPVWCFCSL